MRGSASAFRRTRCGTRSRRHLVRAGVGLVTIRDLLGHRQISSTQIYLHVTAEDLRSAAANHPIARLAPTVEFLLPNVKLPLQYAPSVAARDSGRQRRVTAIQRTDRLQHAARRAIKGVRAKAYFGAD